MAIWRKIHETLRGEITEGLYKTGDRLPTEKELSERFGVNRHTVRRALAEMTAEGAISVRRGSGAYVAEGVVDYRLGQRVRFSQNVTELGRTPAHRLVRSEARAPDDREAEHLRLRPGAEVLVLEMVSEVDGLPVLYAAHSFPAARFPRLAQDFDETRSITASLRRYGVIDYTREWTRITARSPSRKVAAQLRQIESQPVLRVEALNLDMSGEPIEHAVGWWASARTQFVV
ncbi:phosphonate metabolism transcriptional regulator PhnF [Rubrimonas cliftonensis]|uniref:GntR family transcriptional regulator, phosphonate transport system regulatory protein n=1 Tax=Rubrimonas cliftonensis TaxID=89524 RepID=A0A1H4DUZ6_9RHOB|nr:phosphonate metabolism transcriptional regulator PhnF [Rubrimonas cliftonensis]SEA76603.1 GntR family transcriptional regulator, phosphonate transport system regulatory protein [Rubrimonas cliftonensis]